MEPLTWRLSGSLRMLHEEDWVFEPMTQLPSQDLIKQRHTNNMYKKKDILQLQKNFMLLQRISCNFDLATSDSFRPTCGDKGIRISFKLENWH